jgi:hypothetical protein
MSGPRFLKKRVLLLGGVACFVVGAILVLSSSAFMGGSQKPVLNNTDLKSLVLTQSELPSGWKIESQFSYGLYDFPGNETGSGGCGFNWTAVSGSGAYFTVHLYNYSSASEARHSLDLSKSILANISTCEYHEVESTGDYALRVKWNNSGHFVYPYSYESSSQSMFFQVGNIDCVMQLSYLSGFQNPDSAFSYMIILQEEKISTAVR